MNFIIVLIIFIILLTGVALLSVRVQIRYLREGRDDELVVIFSIFKGRLSYKLEISHLELGQNLLRPFLKVKLESEGGGGDPITKDMERILLPNLDAFPNLIKKLFLHMLKYKPVIRYFQRKTRFHEFKWSTEFGLPDPALTGMMVGIVWGIKGTLVSFLQKNLYLPSGGPKISVIPNFQQNKFRLDINCIFDIKIGHIITAGIIFIRKFFQVKEV